MARALRVIFAGTPEFAATALEAIVAAGFAVPLVLTQPDRPAGRGMKLQASAVKQAALEHGIPVAQPPSLRREGKYPAEAAAAFELLRATPHDVMVVAAYGLLLPQEVLDIAPLGCINIHGSLLPRWRGAAPIHRAIQAGDAQTGITIMQMDAGLDTGPMFGMSSVPIEAADTTATLHDKLAALGARMIVETLTALEQKLEEQRLAGAHPARDLLPVTPQPADGATYAQKIGKEEAVLDWSLPAEVLARQIRAFDPFPGAVARWNDTPLKIWAAEMADAPAGEFALAPGTVVSAGPQGIVVACGERALRLTELQKPGGKRLPAREFLAGATFGAGEKLANGAA
ncbi:methionyl-tRNA formyltransferase [Pararobbsia alpina]|uniref:Methionyl-tRNA formyltransferase n=1 Tax=Pararobbsia alpina TaxID=621374 RepID=A0A6S7AVG1_9BURK|nr:methionyl-tRNA formyltransferase [Pararobbsia alpina]CAB3779064.1 Methionyl-tRNA formyltransferase [Pararobbsia alpina]